MPGVTISLDDELKQEIEHFSWVNWSDVARKESLKKEIFERFLKTREITDEDWKFCDKIDWHPVDWLPLKEEFVKELESAKKEKPIRYKSANEFFKALR